MTKRDKRELSEFRRCIYCGRYMSYDDLDNCYKETTYDWEGFPGGMLYGHNSCHYICVLSWGTKNAVGVQGAEVINGN